MTSVLMIYIEPAPYIVGLVAEVKQKWEGSVEVLYVGKSVSQPWGVWIPTAGHEILPSALLAACWTIWQKLKRKRYGVLHLAGWGHPLLVIALIISFFLDIPIVVESDTPTGQKTLKWKNAIKGIFYPWLFRLPKQFLPAGTRQATYLRNFGVEDCRIEIARMTVDVKAIAEHIGLLSSQERRQLLYNHNITPDNIRILYVGRLEPYKGLLDLLKAFSELQREARNVSLLIAGGGSLEKFVKENAAQNPSLCYLGHLTGKQVWNAYAMADIFVLPSIFEPWGLVVNEAMAAGLPVIVTSHVGCGDDLVSEGITGMVIPAQNAQKLTKAIKYLVENGDERLAMGAAGKDVIANWTLDAAAQRTISAWHKAIP